MATKHFITAAFMLLQLISFSQTPTYKSCDSTANSSCDEVAHEAFVSEVQQKIISQMGYYFNDSIHFEIEVGSRGKIKIRKSFFINSPQAAVIAEKYIYNLATKISERSYGKSFTTSFILTIPEDYDSFQNVNLVDNPVPIKACGQYNDKAKRACTRYMAFMVADNIRSKHRLKDDIKARLYLRKGKLKAIKFTGFPMNQESHDFIYSYYNQFAQEEINWAKAGTADNQWIELNVFESRDSAERYAYIQKRLGYLVSINQKQAYLEELFPFARRYFKEKGEAEFLVQNLENLGYTSGTQLQVSGKTYDFDSIKTYKPEGAEPIDEELALKESVPVYKGCNPDEDNEKLKQCFQMELLQFVGTEFKFPEEARQKRIMGRVYVSFVIEKDGKIDEIAVVRGAHRLLDYESIRIVSLIPDVERPAMQKGEPVRMSFTLPINAKLQ